MEHLLQGKAFGWAKLTAMVVSLMLPAGWGSVFGATPFQHCTGVKVKAGGKAVYASTKCYQRARLTGSPVDPACLTRAAAKLRAKFASAETLGACPGDASSAVEAVSAWVTTFDGSIWGGTARCAAAKIKATGKTTADQATCEQRAAVKGIAVDPACLAKAEAKFAAAVGKADGLGVCSGTATALQALIDECVVALRLTSTPTTTTNPPTQVATELPWVVLVCRFSDDADPSQVLVRDLPFLDDAANDTETALDLFQWFFTKLGGNTFNATRYFSEMSHGLITIDNSQVFVVNMPFTKAQGSQQDGETGAAYSARITRAAQNAAVAQGVSLQNFYGIVITSHALLAMAQGGGIPGGAVVTGSNGWPIGWAGMDYRWVRNNGIQSFGQEMGHGFGLDHSRRDGSNEDYKDPWDVMSTRAAASATDSRYGMRGPGLNAWNMRSRGWLDESRVWKAGGSFDQTIQLRPLHRRDLSGWLAAELPPADGPGGHGRYLVEYRVKEGWDAAIPRSAVLVHRFEGAIGQFLGTHSYVMSSAEIGTLWLSTQLVANGGFGTWTLHGDARGVGEIAIGRNADGRLEVFALDANEGSAWHTWQTSPNGSFGGWQIMGDARGLGRIAVGSNADGRLEVFALDANEGSAWHTWQTSPNGSFGGWQIMGDARGLGHLAVASNADGRLEIFATDGADDHLTSAGLVWHSSQVTPNGGWGGWVRLGDAVGVGPIAVGSNADGRLEVFAVDVKEGSAWHAWQTSPSGSFGGWQIMGDARGIGRIVVTSNADGRLEIFANDTAAGLAWHDWQVTPNGGWHGWARLGDAAGVGPIAAGRNADGRLEMFALDTSEGLAWHAAQQSANGSFGGWQLVADQHGGLGNIAVAPNADGSLQVAAVDSRGHADLVAGESAILPAVAGSNAQVQVVSIDHTNYTATVRLTLSGPVCGNGVCEDGEACVAPQCGPVATDGCCCADCGCSFGCPTACVGPGPEAKSCEIL